MEYIELRDKLQKALGIMENKRWVSREQMEMTAVATIMDFFAQEELSIFTASDSKISFVLTDYPLEPRCLFIYKFEFKTDKRRPDGKSDYLLHVQVDPTIDLKYWEMDIMELFEHMNHHAGILHNQETLIKEKEILLKRVERIEEELRFIRVALEKFD